jgi:hypothetical protein
MHNDNGGSDEKLTRNVPALRQTLDAQELVRKTLESTSLALRTEERVIRRGKFFLSNREQQLHGSVRRPIFQYWGHGVVVGETRPTDDGVWCYGAHNDFDLLPESMSPDDWPEYTRTPTGWVRKDGNRRISDNGTFSNGTLKLPSQSLEEMLERLKSIKRLT